MPNNTNKKQKWKHLSSQGSRGHTGSPIGLLGTWVTRHSRKGAHDRTNTIRIVWLHGGHGTSLNSGAKARTHEKAQAGALEVTGALGNASPSVCH